MEQIKAQRRMLLCAALFSFGSICGALTLSRLSQASQTRFIQSVCSFLSLNPLLLIPLTAVFGPVLMLTIGPSLFGILVIIFLFVVYGFIGGVFEFLTVLRDCHPFITTAFLLLCSFCFLQIGGYVLRLAMLRRKQAASSGLTRPDRVFDAPRVVGAFVVLLVASFAFALFILKT